MLEWVLTESDASVYEQLFHDRPEVVLSVTQLPYTGMLVRFVDGREIDIPPLTEAFMDSLLGFERDPLEDRPTWSNVLSVVRVNAAIETRAINALLLVADRLGYELRERRRPMPETEPAANDLDVVFV
ncbi:MAG: hypothetical protein EBS23_00595, partial [Betaproteobacteria bacterium]|nr:hypothetical protein [Betaproteobacteria bacterium]